MQQVCVVALLRRWGTEWLKAIVKIMGRIEAGAPALVGEGRIGDNEVERLECAGFLEFGIALLVTFSVTVAACGGGGGGTSCPNVITAGTTAGTYTITVTGTSGSTTTTGTVTVTVQ
jgi:hypothetical protein